jgi:hypothetical protein
LAWVKSIENPSLVAIANYLPGQRYDVIVTADQASIASDFWMRAIPQISCSDNDSVDNIKGIVHYGSSTSTPTTLGYAYTDECLDETNLIPFVSKTVGTVTVEADEAAGIARNSNNYLRWTLNGTSMLINWDNPVSLFHASIQLTRLTNGSRHSYKFPTTNPLLPSAIHRILSTSPMLMNGSTS